MWVNNLLNILIREFGCVLFGGAVRDMIDGCAHSSNNPCKDYDFLVIQNNFDQIYKYLNSPMFSVRMLNDHKLYQFGELKSFEITQNCNNQGCGKDCRNIDCDKKNLFIDLVICKDSFGQIPQRDIDFDINQLVYDGKSIKTINNLDIFQIFSNIHHKRFNVTHPLVFEQKINRRITNIRKGIYDRVVKMMYRGWKMNNDLQLISNLKHNDCTICLASMREKNCMLITKCGHAFHTECLGNWIKENFKYRIQPKCPNCNQTFCVFK